MNKYNSTLRRLIVAAAVLLLGSILLFFIVGNPAPAEAQAQELFNLYFEIDQVRQDSAQIFAELIEAATDPERVGAEEGIGSKPALSSQEELSGRLTENQESVEQTLATINANRFTDPEVNRRHDEVRSFYTTLFEFEDMVLAELSNIENNGEQSASLGRMINTIFEGTDWPALLAKDAQLRDTLTSLAELHELEFTPASYEDLFRERLIELNTPIISDEVNTIVYPFTVDETAVHQVVLSIEFDIELSDKIKISLEDPRGRIISSDQLAEYDQSAQMNHLSYIHRDNSSMAIKLFPDDQLVMPITGDWKLYVTAPVGSNVVIGMIQL